MTRRSSLRFVPFVESFEARLTPAADYLLQIDGVKGESSSAQPSQPAAWFQPGPAPQAQTGTFTLTFQGQTTLPTNVVPMLQPAVQKVR